MELNQILEKVLVYQCLSEYYQNRNKARFAYCYQKYLHYLQRFAQQYGDEMERDFLFPRDDFKNVGKIRFAHAANQLNHTVDIYVNQTLVVSKLAFGGITSYLQLIPGKYSIEVYPSGNLLKPILEQEFSVSEHACTLVIGEEKATPMFLLFEDDLEPVKERVKLRFLHFSANAPQMDVAIRGGHVLFSEVKYGQARFITLPPGRIDLELRLSGANKQIYVIPQIQLEEQKNYSLFAGGKIKGSPAFRMLVVEDI
jgi:hypothetical protein